METDTLINGAIATVCAGHILLFVSPLWGVFVYVGAMFISFGGLVCRN